jgi:rhodanese-related sulfurtransferase
VARGRRHCEWNELLLSWLCRGHGLHLSQLRHHTETHQQTMIMQNDTETLPDPAAAQQFFSNKMQFTTGPVEVNRRLKEKEEVNVVDVRDAKDFEKSHVPNAQNLPQERWSDVSALRRDRLNIIYCYTQTCHLAASAAMEFARKGFSVMEMEGGFEAWEANDLPVQKGVPLQKAA